MIKLYTLKFNNYFNRKMLKLDSVGDYLIDAYYTSGHVTANVSFNLKDGVTTDQIINYVPNGEDYAILVKEETSGSETVKTILSRWFIIEADKQLTGQYRLTLQRDAIADNYDDLKDAPIYVNKGVLDNNDDMICNDEGFIVNRIKKEEKLLYQQNPTNSADTIKAPFIIGYVTKNALGVSQVTVETDDIEQGTPVATIAEKLGITETQFVSMLNFNDTQANPSYSIAGETNFIYGLDKYSGSFERVRILFNSSLEATKTTTTNAYLWADPLLKENDGYTETDLRIFKSATTAIFNSETTTKLLSMIRTASGKQTLNNDQYKALHDYNGQVVYYNNKNYRVSFIYSSTLNENFALPYTNAYLIEYLNKYPTYMSGYSFTNLGGNLYIQYGERKEYIMLEEVATGEIVIPLASETSRKDCSGSTCDIFAIPFGSLPIGESLQGELLETFKTLNDKELLYKIASSLATQLDANCYDIQLLPYAPINYQLDYYEKIVADIMNLTEHVDYDYIYKNLGSGNKENVSVIFWLNKANYSFDIITNETVSDRKIESQTKMLRLCSPNYQGLYDFNVAKNNGLDKLTVNMTLKPYQPYIQVLPNFKSLYGGNFNDYRGLICNGDFSLSRVSEAWINYQLNNKNYQNIFNREMESLDLAQQQERFKSYFSLGTGVVGGGIGGAMAGSKAGPYGAIAGAIAGTSAGIVGGALDFQLAEQVRANTKDYAKDKYAFSLGNIQAMPNSLTKIDTFAINSKLFPFMEFYEATEAETKALENKVKYDGMTIDRIGTIREFESGNAENYFKGQFIRLPLNDDTHMLNYIYDEVLKGIYI